MKLDDAVQRAVIANNNIRAKIRRRCHRILLSIESAALRERRSEKPINAASIIAERRGAAQIGQCWRGNLARAHAAELTSMPFMAIMPHVRAEVAELADALG